MATVRISNTVAGVLVANGYTGAPITTSGAFPSTISGGGAAGSALLIIYKGTPENFATFTDRATRSSDVLITFSLPAAAGSYTDLGQINAGAANAARSFKVGIALANQAASATGTATWFLMVRAGTTSLTDKGAFMGTVGTTGSGADMEIPSTSIVSGSNYQSNGFYFNFPQNWTV